MLQFGGKDSKRHFTVVMGGKEHGLYVSSTPSSAAKKAVTKLCTANKSKKVEFYIREITQGSKKKTYGPYEWHIEKLKEPIELKGRVIKYKPVAKLSGKTGAKKGGMRGGMPESMIKSEITKYYDQLMIKYNTQELNRISKPKFPEKLIPRFITKLLNNEKCPIHGQGKTRRNFIYVDDVSRAVDTILRKGEINEIYNIGSDDEYSVMDVLKTLIEEMGIDSTI